MAVPNGEIDANFQFSSGLATLNRVSSKMVILFSKHEKISSIFESMGEVFFASVFLGPILSQDSSVSVSVFWGCCLRRSKDSRRRPQPPNKESNAFLFFC